jgi:transporter family-2 protein
MNPWLGSTVAFLPVVAFLGVVLLCLPKPFADRRVVITNARVGTLWGASSAHLRWWPVLFVGKVGAGVIAGPPITANILMSLVIDIFGLFAMDTHALSVGRRAGPALAVADIALISYFKPTDVDYGHWTPTEP